MQIVHAEKLNLSSPALCHVRAAMSLLATDTFGLTVQTIAYATVEKVD